MIRLMCTIFKESVEGKTEEREIEKKVGGRLQYVEDFKSIFEDHHTLGKHASLFQFSFGLGSSNT